MILLSVFLWLGLSQAWFVIFSRIAILRSKTGNPDYLQSGNLWDRITGDISGFKNIIVGTGF